MVGSFAFPLEPGLEHPLLLDVHQYRKVHPRADAQLAELIAARGEIGRDHSGSPRLSQSMFQKRTWAPPRFHDASGCVQRYPPSHATALIRITVSCPVGNDWSRLAFFVSG